MKNLYSIIRIFLLNSQPVAFELCDDVANSFQYKINQSTFEGSWSDVNTKVGKFNRWFPQEYTGELYAGRIENGWVVYNGLAGIRNAAIPFKYNTCDKMELAYSKYCLLYTSVQLL